ncbi:Plasmid stability protein [Serratia fonticola]|nr:plasmid partitioning/stability family protein [Serratia fonticola]CAI1922393.1 Plasmid stability protein [Serratia fonticola]
MNRRKVLIYLRPDTHAGEHFADTRLEAHHRGDRGELSRTALLAGIALGEIDSRLPSVLAALLADNTSPETLRTMLVSFLNIPSEALQCGSVTVEGPLQALAEQQSGSVSAKNLSGLLPE